MTPFSGNYTSGSRKSPATYSHRPGLARGDLSHSTPSSDSETDSDRISKLSRGVRNHGPLTQKATEAVRGRHQGKAPRKPLQKHGPLIIPFAKPAVIKFKPRPFPTSTWVPNSAKHAPVMILVAVLGLPQQPHMNRFKTFQTIWMQSLNL